MCRFSLSYKTVCFLALGLLFGSSILGHSGPLHEAIQAGDAATVASLLEDGADPNARDHRRDTPLKIAIEHNNAAREQIVNLLLNYGADVETKSQGHSPLYYAVSDHGSDLRPVIRALLAYGANVNGLSNGNLPLCIAAGRGEKGIVRTLLNHGAEANAIDTFYARPLGCVLTSFGAYTDAQAGTFGDREDIVDILIRAGADVNAWSGANGHTPLLLATSLQQNRLVRSLIKSDADVNKASQPLEPHRDFEIHTPLSMAVMSKKDKSLAMILLRKGADPDVRPLVLRHPVRGVGGIYGERRLERVPLIYWAAEEGLLDMVSLLLDYDADPDVPYHDGSSETALGAAIKERSRRDSIRVHGGETGPVEDYADIVRLLLEEGANPDSRPYRADHDHNFSAYGSVDALYVAASFSYTEIVRLLLWHGADLTPVSQYLGFGDPTLDMTLLDVMIARAKNPDNPQAKDFSSYRTSLPSLLGIALYVAIRDNDTANLELLLEAEEVPANTQTGAGWTALHMAAREGDVETVNDLLDMGADADLQNNDGQTALHLAARRGNAETVGVLLDHGADATIQNTYGRTARAVAQAFGQTTIEAVFASRDLQEE